jgi:hypothetical protein
MAPPSTSFTSAAMPAFAEAPDERARMGRISGVLWILAAFITVANCYLPGAQHVAIGWVFALSGAFFLYGVVSALGWLRWDAASMKVLGVGMALTIPVIGLGIYLTGGAMSFVQPMLVLTLLYAAFFFPSQWAWPLSIELILAAGTPLLYDGKAIEEAFLPTYVALVAGFLAATWVLVGLKKRLLEAELHHRDIAHRDPLTGVANRRQFDAVLGREIAARSHPGGGRRENDESPLALLILDLDDFSGSTTTTATRSATRSSARSPNAPSRCCAPVTPSPGSAATSSRSSRRACKARPSETSPNPSAPPSALTIPTPAPHPPPPRSAGQSSPRTAATSRH